MPEATPQRAVETLDTIPASAEELALSMGGTPKDGTGVATTTSQAGQVSASPTSPTSSLPPSASQVEGEVSF